MKIGTKEEIKQYLNFHEKLHKKYKKIPCKPKDSPRVFLTIVFAIMVFCILAITMLIMGCISIFLQEVGLIDLGNQHNMWMPIFAFAVASIVTGTVVAVILSRIPLKPIHVIIEAMNQLASGQFETRIYMGHLSISQKISNSFNTLAEELEQTELLRSDFVNNFSHEFKTPIVSIGGFAKLLQKDNLPEEKRKEYLGIIVEESSRLSAMATNVLNLTKVENQSILTEVTKFNVSEQIRNSVLMLENKWVTKEILMNLDFGEKDILANEELLKQVWINIIDNSIKFSPQQSSIEIYMEDKENMIQVSICNHGPKMSEEEMRRMYDKFWQGDTSHASEGNGIGLSIAKRIIDLHKGNIKVESTDRDTSFIVELPK